MSAPLSLPIVFVGLPGSGKSKVGIRLASVLGVEHLDTDTLVQERTGRTISEIFETEGEAAFREYEALAVEEALKHQAVISLGGGAVTHPRTRELLADHTVIHLRVPIAELLRRVARKDHRPLLRHNPEEVLRRLDEQRRAFFEDVRTFVVDSDDSPIEKVVGRIQSLLESTSRVTVRGERDYDVIIGTKNVAADIAAALPSGTQRVLVIHPPVMTDYSASIAKALENEGLTVSLMCHPDGEAAKTVEVLAKGWEQASEARLARTDAIVGIGGGTTTDVAGFIAATWLRGIAVVQVPTTVLGMVDAAIGGKTGINTSAGKNLAGAFHAPHGVIEDLAVLKTLPVEQHRAGLAEAIKCGFIRDREILNIVLRAPLALLDPESEELHEVMRRAIQVKADVVGTDLKESGLREILNYGHTLAHAIEKSEDYRWSHGYAVAVGCVFAAELAYELGLLTNEDIQLHRDAFAAVGLPTSYNGVSFEALLNVMHSDKKVRQGKLRFVLLEGICSPATYEVSIDDLRVVAERLGMV